MRAEFTECLIGSILCSETYENMKLYYGEMIEQALRICVGEFY